MLMPIAIVGIGCRFPGANGPDALWQLLHEGRSPIGNVPSWRWDAAALSDPHGNSPGSRGGYLDDIDFFDPSFFGISPEEAGAMDPQQRLMLETAWTCLEDSAVDPQSLAGTNTGVFVGVASLNYGSVALQQLESVDRFSNVGSGGGAVANRISYFLDLRGPSFAVDAACASSLLAVHLACESLWRGECDGALAGGVNAILLPGGSVGLSRSGMLSPDNECRVFDAAANGTVRGEGAGLVFLKPLDAAVASGDPIYAVIRSTAVTQNGKSNGIGGPSRQAQEAVLRRACERARIDPARVEYVEAHSTGTLIGDATEIAALGAVFGNSRPSRCAIGSIKPNLGHLEAAAGIAGLAKVALMLRKGRLVPTLNFRQPNSYANPDQLNLAVQTTAAEWLPREGGRVGAVSAAGNAGCNVHVVLGEGPEHPPTPEGDGPFHLTVSAKTPQSLTELCAAHARFLSDYPEVSTPDFCATVNHGRARMRQSTTLVAADRLALQEALKDVTRGRMPPGGDSPRPATGRRTLNVPTYPFQRRRFWLETWPVPTLVASPRPQVSQTLPAGEPPEAPTDDVEQRLVNIWQSVLPDRTISTDKSFFDLGGTSVHALQLFDGIEREFGTALPLAELYSAPTVQALASLLRAPAEPRRWDPLVLLNQGGTRRPLFLVPGLGGHAFDLRTLARRLGADQPVYVLHPQGLDPAQVPLTSIEDMAAAFVERIKSVQSAGPFFLGGYSFGGSVAFEMARRLERAGDTVGLLAMLDAYAPEAFKKKSVSHRLVTHLHQLWGLNSRNRRDYLRQRVASLMRRFSRTPAAPAPGPGVVIDAVQRITDANQQAWRAYRPGAYSGRVLLFRASPREKTLQIFCDSDPANGWNRYAAGGVEVIQLPCDHLAIFKGESLDMLASQVAARIPSSDDRPARRAG
jgi:3-oxoacyl-(acyl-carrier-protein) synthase/thioesterase domain-containing protein/acyl carrier protein